MSARPAWLQADVTRRPDETLGSAHARRAQENAGAFPGLAPLAEDWRPDRVGVVGAGTMGGGIAMAFANAGIPAILVDRTDADAQRGLERIRANYQHSVARGRLSTADLDTRMALLTASGTTDVLTACDVVVEAVFEDLDLKRRVFADIDRVAPVGALLCTNTSGLDIDRIADATGRPGAVVGTHFFSPANVMRLLEVVSGTATTPEALARVLRIGALIGKVAVPAGNAPNFIGNAMLADYSRETHFLVEEGAFPADVDRVLESFGFAMGLFRVGDMAGLDVGIEAKRAAIASRPNDRRFSDLRFVPVDMGRRGQKTGAGWYRYEPGSREALRDPDFEAALVRHSEHIGIERRTIEPDEIIARCMYALVNRAAWLLGDGVAAKPSDVDAVYVTGYGFPAAVGGPLFWADTVGLSDVAADIVRLHEQFGAWWEPAPLLLELARTGRSFDDLNPKEPVTP